MGKNPVRGRKTMVEHRISHRGLSWSSAYKRECSRRSLHTTILIRPTTQRKSKV